MILALSNVPQKEMSAQPSGQTTDCLFVSLSKVWSTASHVKLSTLARGMAGEVISNYTSEKGVV